MILVGNSCKVFFFPALLNSGWSLGKKKTVGEGTRNKVIKGVTQRNGFYFGPTCELWLSVGKASDRKAPRTLGDGWAVVHWPSLVSRTPDTALLMDNSFNNWKGPLITRNVSFSELLLYLLLFKIAT